MGTRYTTVSVSGYNATPPSDDGTVSESNKIKWSTIKTKLPDPLKTALESIDSKLSTHFNNGPTALIASTTLDSTHYNKIIQVSGSAVTLTLTDASTLGAGWYCEIVNTDSSNSVTLGRATSGDTINGTAANITMSPLQSLRIFVNSAANGFYTTQDVNKRTNNTFTNAGMTGEIKIWPATTPTGWLACDGTSYATATYPDLYAVIGYTFGGSGANFNVPDLRRKVPVGSGGTGTATLGNAIGNTGGAETHTLAESEVPATLLKNVAGYTDGGTPNISFNLNTGGGQPHNNMQPSLVINYIIKI